jgi:hypothetical protein
VVEGGLAPGAPVTPWNLRDRLVALGSTRIGLDLRWWRLAPRSCWPGLPSEFETSFDNAIGRCAVSLAGPSGARAMSLPWANFSDMARRHVRAESAFGCKTEVGLRGCQGNFLPRTDFMSRALGSFQRDANSLQSVCFYGLLDHADALGFAD